MKKVFFHIFLKRKKNINSNSYTRECINYISNNIKGKYDYKIYFVDDNVDFPELDESYTNIFIWDQVLVKKSFDLIEESPCLHVVFLKYKTNIFRNDSSINEPVDENFLIFNNMKCIYLRPDKNEISYEYDTIVSDSTYVFDITKINL